jgi:hypothetical protein
LRKKPDQPAAFPGHHLKEHPVNDPIFVGCDEDRHTLIAALRFWQQQGMCEPRNRSDEMHDLATNGDALTSLCDEDVDALIEQLNF